VEIVEIQQPNSGRDAFPALLKRAKLPKNASSNHPDVSRIGANAKDEQVVYYSDKDLKVGGTISVYTRSLELRGCDQFTQEYYVKTYAANPDDYHELIVEEEVEHVPKMLPPPHNGIGTEEDSLGSFLYLMPKVPKQDFKKLMENDGVHLRYMAKFSDPQVEDKDRRFIITYYLANDTVSVFEKFERNSGFIGGKFFERSRIKNPATSEYFKAADFFQGAKLTINTYDFDVLEGDDYTSKYMKEQFGDDAADEVDAVVENSNGGKTQVQATAGASAAAAAAPAATAAAAAPVRTERQSPKGAAAAAPVSPLKSAGLRMTSGSGKASGRAK